MMQVGFSGSYLDWNPEKRVPKLTHQDLSRTFIFVNSERKHLCPIRHVCSGSRDGNSTIIQPQLHRAARRHHFSSPVSPTIPPSLSYTVGSPADCDGSFEHQESAMRLGDLIGENLARQRHGEETTGKTFARAETLLSNYEHKLLQCSF